MSRRAVGVLVAIGVQLLVLAGLLGFKQYTVATGTTVRLRTAPVDPSSLFEGDYLQLRYEISSLDRSLLRDTATPAPGSDLFVELAPGDDGVWRAVAAYAHSRSVAHGHVLLKGTVRDETFGWSPAGANKIRVEYGIEQLYVEEGSTRAAQAGTALTVAVKVDRFGNAVARRLVWDQ